MFPGIEFTVFSSVFESSPVRLQKYWEDHLAMTTVPYAHKFSSDVSMNWFARWRKEFGVESRKFS
jgi:hypothetical protein